MHQLLTIAFTLRSRQQRAGDAAKPSTPRGDGYRYPVVRRLDKRKGGGEVRGPVQRRDQCATSPRGTRPVTAFARAATVIRPAESARSLS